LELPFTLTGELKGKNQERLAYLTMLQLLVMPFVGY